MQFEYEITIDDYVACQILYYKLNTGRNYPKWAIYWILAGIFFLLVSWGEWALHWSQVLLAAIGVWCIYAGSAGFFLGRHFRRAYQSTGFSGKKFQANLDEKGFEVAGSLQNWRVQWPAVSVKGESKDAFILSDGGSMFMFGKRYLTDEQQRELRRLAALPIP